MIDTPSSNETAPDDLRMTVRQFKNSPAYMNSKERSMITALAGKTDLAQLVRDAKQKSPHPWQSEGSGPPTVRT